ncbi:MAG: ATP-binding protein [Prevotellaceae bacterium]|jgi:predicted ATPase|nr:ATP-binding protein [Prevotellaceae bacterium]
MITQITIQNFKRIESLSFSLSSSVVIVGPNNSGKSTLFQALCLWEIGVKKFIAARKKDNGCVIINRRDMLNSPVLDALYLWKNKRVTCPSDKGKGKGQKHIPITIELQGEHNGKQWRCKAEFIFANAESFTCRVLSGLEEVSEMFNGGTGIHFGFLQAMSGISTSEDKLTQGSIDRKLGEGKTAEVLRNICFEILYPETKAKETADAEQRWQKLCKIVKSMFGVSLKKPELITSTGLVLLEYVEDGITYDIASGGRGFQQILLLFAYQFANPNTILLLDEPDAHLEVIRQRESFRLINEIADETNTQILITSHSEVVLNEAASTSKVIALIENKTIELNTSQSIGYVRKALTEIGWDKYYLARSKGHILYLEGETDLNMLLAFANKLRHPVESLLRVANVQYTSNNVPSTAISNFVALQEIFNGLKGLALFDFIPNLQANPKLDVICWQRRELENYFARPQLLVRHAKLFANDYKQFTATQLGNIMQEVITDYTLPIYLKDETNAWWNSAKLSDEWLDKIFPEFYNRLNISVGLNYKRDYYHLIALMDKNNIPQEVTDKLDAIYELLK